MKKLILQVSDKRNLEELKKFSTIVYVSSFTNAVGIEIHERDIPKLEMMENVTSYSESRSGTYLPCAL